MHLSSVVLLCVIAVTVECMSKLDLERRALSRAYRLPTASFGTDHGSGTGSAPEVVSYGRNSFYIPMTAAVAAPNAAYREHLQWEHDEIDSRAVSENVDLEKVDDAGFERLRRALHAMKPRVGVRLWKREAIAWGIDQ